MVYYHYTLQLRQTGLDDVSRTIMTTLTALVSKPPPTPFPKKSFSWIWILCQNSLTRELKIRYVQLVL